MLVPFRPVAMLPTASPDSNSCSHFEGLGPLPVIISSDFLAILEYFFRGNCAMSLGGS